MAIFNLTQIVLKQGGGGGGLPDFPKAGDFPVALAVNTDNHSISGTTYTTTGLSVTIPRTGTYRIKRKVWRLDEGTDMGTVLYRERAGEAIAEIGPRNISWNGSENRHQYTVEEIECKQGDVIILYAKSSSTYVIYPEYLSACIDWDGGSSSYDTYDGPYTVIPKTTPQTLDTDNKLLGEDVVVEEVPYYEVPNPYQGNTIYIASDYEDNNY